MIEPKRVSVNRLLTSLSFACLIGACTGTSAGTFEADVSGALKAHVSGRATASQTSATSTSGNGYIVDLTLPAKIQGMEAYQAGRIMLEGQHQPAAGDYTVVSGSAVPIPATALTVDFDGPDGNTLWDAIGGKVHIAVSNRLSGKLTGTFTARFASFGDRPDTILIVGKFDLR
ncbi:MAG: hypothetical protein ABJE47_12525 [bacterium]